MNVYYNEIDPYCCEWLRNLIAAGLLPAGDVDGRDIREVSPSDLDGYTSCHFFAGIGGWPYALRLAGWPDDRPVWTGSCPCQPFSAAGKGKASSDERHLWPAWFELIRSCKPATIFGEQVEAAIGWGWLDLVHSDLEPEGYAVGAAVLPAASVGAPHIRQRLWFCGLLGNTHSFEANATEQRQSLSSTRCLGGELVNPQRRRCQQRDESERQLSEPRAAIPANPWSNLIWLPCTDGKQRPTQSGVFPLAHGIPSRVAKLRAAGNAIVPQVAAEFIKAAMT